jgi:hypothetical protein
MKKTKHKIIDNFLDKKDFEKIEFVMQEPDFPWYMCQSVSAERDVKVTERHKLKPEDFYFFHNFQYFSSINSTYYQMLIPIIKKLDPVALHRVKGNLYPSRDKKFEHGYHIDLKVKHKAAIFYVNTNNGYTILNDGTKIESIKNRILLFDASEPHTSTNCTDLYARINININYF